MTDGAEEEQVRKVDDALLQAPIVRSLGGRSHGRDSAEEGRPAWARDDSFEVDDAIVAGLAAQARNGNHSQ